MWFLPIRFIQGLLEYFFPGYRPEVLHGNPPAESAYSGKSNIGGVVLSRREDEFKKRILYGTVPRSQVPRWRFLLGRTGVKLNFESEAHTCPGFVSRDLEFLWTDLAQESSRAWMIRRASAVQRFSSDCFIPSHSVRCTGGKVELLMWTTCSRGGPWKTLVRSFSGATCLVQSVGRGRTNRGRDGGVRIGHIMRRLSF